MKDRKCLHCGIQFTPIGFNQKYCNCECAFWGKVEKLRPVDCWDWTGSLRGGGYGQIKVGPKLWDAHRYSWTLHFGEIPNGMWVLHKCDNRKCVNPEHLYLGTALDNNRDTAIRERKNPPKGEGHFRAKLCPDKV